MQESDYIIIGDKKYLRRIKNNTENPHKVKLNQLFLYKMGAGGTTITCNDCGYNERIVFSIHGGYSNKKGTWANLGYQCQSCGKFQTLDIQSKNLVCSCGGLLSRKAPLFCPQCKSDRIHYEMLFIT